jgi:hypothetical protein
MVFLIFKRQRLKTTRPVEKEEYSLIHPMGAAAA